MYRKSLTREKTICLICNNSDREYSDSDPTIEPDYTSESYNSSLSEDERRDENKQQRASYVGEGGDVMKSDEA